MKRRLLRYSRSSSSSRRLFSSSCRRRSSSACRALPAASRSNSSRPAARASVFSRCSRGTVSGASLGWTEKGLPDQSGRALNSAARRRASSSRSCCSRCCATASAWRASLRSLCAWGRGERCFELKGARAQGQGGGLGTRFFGFGFRLCGLQAPESQQGPAAPAQPVAWWRWAAPVWSRHGEVPRRRLRWQHGHLGGHGHGARRDAAPLLLLAVCFGAHRGVSTRPGHGGEQQTAPRGRRGGGHGSHALRMLSSPVGPPTAPAPELTTRRCSSSLACCAASCWRWRSSVARWNGSGCVGSRGATKGTALAIWRTAQGGRAWQAMGLWHGRGAFLEGRGAGRQGSRGRGVRVPH